METDHLMAINFIKMINCVSIHYHHFFVAMANFASFTTAESEQIDTDNPSSWWDLTSPSKVDMSNSTYDHIIIPPEFNVANTDFSDTTEIKFVVRLRDNYILPSKAFLLVDVTLTRVASDIVGLLNPASQVLFNSCYYSINESEVEKTTKYSSLRALALGLTSYSKPHIETLASDRGWYLDTGAGGNSIDPGVGPLNMPSYTSYPFVYDAADPASVPVGAPSAANVQAAWVGLATPGNVNTAANYNGRLSTFAIGLQTGGGFNYSIVQTYNKGFDYRARMLPVFPAAAPTTTSRYVFRVPLSEMFAFCRDIPKVFRGFDHTITLMRNNQINEMVMTGLNGLGAAAATARANTHLKFNSIQLYMPYVKPSFTQMAKLEEFFAKAEMMPLLYYPSEVYSSTYVNAATTIDWNIKKLDKRPMHIYFFMIDNRANQSAKNTFAHNSLTQLKAIIGAVEIPTKNGIVCDFANGNWIQAYQMYLECCGKESIDEGVALSYKEFGSLYPMFCFDFSTLEDEVFAGGKELQLQGRFTAAANGTFYAVVTYRNGGILQTMPDGVRFISKSS